MSPCHLLLCYWASFQSNTLYYPCFSPIKDKKNMHTWFLFLFFFFELRFGKANTALLAHLINVSLQYLSILRRRAEGRYVRGPQMRSRRMPAHQVLAICHINSLLFLGQNESVMSSVSWRARFSRIFKYLSL